MVARIIVVEDENLTRATLVAALREEGFDVRGASDAEACRAALKAQAADLVVLDLGLPGEDGLAYAQELRATSDVAVLVVTARGATEVQVTALDSGADTFLVKPVAASALVANVRALLRRKPASSEGKLCVAGWLIDLERRVVTSANDEPATLTRGEFNVLALLAQADGRIVGRELLSEAVNRGESGENLRDIRSVDALVSRLRRKLGSTLIATAPGFGYRLCAKVERQ
jgi:two-component system torCAD operon response regulator TorR